MQETQETWVRSLGQEDPWRRKRQPMPVSLPGESMGRGAWWATVYMVTKNWTWLSTPKCNFWSTFRLYEFAYCTYFTCGIRQYLSLDIWFISVDIMFSRLQWVFFFSFLLVFCFFFFLNMRGNVWSTTHLEINQCNDFFYFCFCLEHLL